jgi:hypothetical protein
MSVVQLTLPNDNDAPAKTAKCGHVASVAFGVASKLLHPEVAICFRHVSKAAAHVLVPETTVHEHDRSPARKHNVWPSRQAIPVEAESEARSVKKGSNDALRTRVLSANP